MKKISAKDVTTVISNSEMNSLVESNPSWKNYREQYDKTLRYEKIDFPVQIDFELNSSCNLTCPMCPISAESPKGKGPKTWFDFETYKKLIDYAVDKGTKAIRLNYVNEPLIRKDISKFIFYAKNKGILDIYLSTNGVLLTKEMAEMLTISGLSRIQISIDAVSHEVYNKMRPGGDLDKVKKNIETLRSVRENLGSLTPLIRVNFVKTEINEHELQSFVDEWEDVVDAIGVQEFILPPVSSTKFNVKSNAIQENFKCSIPFRLMVINNEKNVLPCCSFWGESLSLGSLSDPNDLITYWNSKAMNDLRKAHAEGRGMEIPECRKCFGFS